MVRRVSTQHKASLAILLSVAVFCLLVVPVPSFAVSDPAGLTLPITGTAGTAKFTGNVRIQRFVQVSGQIKAVAMISGTLVDAAGVPLGSTLKGPLLLPVTVGPSGSASLTKPQGTNAGLAGMSPGPSIARPIVLLMTPAAAPQATTCTALDIQIGAANLNIAGLTVTTLPIGITVGGETGGTNALGTLVCNILSTLTNVANLLNLLNQLLGLVGGLV